MDFGLKGKRAIVMAASRGLGYASALGLAREGCRLIICSRDQERIEAAAAAIRKETGADVKALVADVSSASEAKRLVDAAVSAYGGLEIVVHNAGGPPAGETLAMTDEQWQKAFEQNLLSFTRIVGAAAPEMKKAGYGRVLTIASSSIKQPIPNLALSNALRAGVWGIAKTLSRELAPQGILVNVIAPGRIDTERIAELDQANAQKSGKPIEDVRKASVGEHSARTPRPARGVGEPCRIPGVASGQLHHRSGHHRGWRRGECAVDSSRSIVPLSSVLRPAWSSRCWRRSPSRPRRRSKKRVPSFPHSSRTLKEQALAAGVSAATVDARARRPRAARDRRRARSQPGRSGAHHRSIRRSGA